MRESVMTITKEISKFLTSAEFEKLPVQVIEQAKKCFLDWLGVALGGSTHPICNILIEFTNNIGGAKQSTILGRGVKTNLLNSALVNGAISHVLDFDDTHEASQAHISNPIMPVIFALGEYKNITGRECVTAFVSGFETSSRIGMAIRPYHYDAGWHATSTLGHLGSTAAAGKLMRLNDKQMRYALGIGATQAGGLTAVFGTMCKPFHAGKAAMDGILAAMLAKKGFDSADNILEAKKGYCQIFSTTTDYDTLLSGLGNDFQILNNSFKPYASCLLTHSPIDCILNVRDAQNIIPKDIEKISVRVAPFAMEIAGKMKPKNHLEAKFSIPFCIAVTLLEGEAGEDKFNDDMIKDPRIFDLLNLITVEADRSFDNFTAEVMIQTKKGALLTEKIYHPKGSAKNPLSFHQLEHKFRALANPVISERKIEKLLEIIRNLENLEDFNSLISLCY